MPHDPAVDIAVPLIGALEGFASVPYQDIAYVWTIGFGFTYLPDGTRVTAETPEITREEAIEWLRSGVAAVVAHVRLMVNVPITDNQAAALASLAYNEGTGRIAASTLVRVLNEGNYAEASRQFMAWVYADGHPSPGLTRRRTMERELFDRAIPNQSTGVEA